ncbi:hypothetical protein LSTR_LSTR007009 [Laodelphax striatellus]|uniref:Hexosyltransferase n=1 Tax=Laodelphax striatellus TaxID=195883 RepID=A0A482WKB4_LAOST|nr:hypothetical protein LSTR_LSTR007009 [Laodelphax striatellus]
MKFCKLCKCIFRHNVFSISYSAVELPTIRENANKTMFRSTERRCVRYLVFCLLSLCFLLALYSPVYQPSEQHESMVHGWEVNVSRDSRLYVQPDNSTAIIAASEICQTGAHTSPLFLLVIICSAVPHLERRNAIRETWASNLGPDVKVAFLLGDTDNATLQAKIEEESSLTKDVIQENFIDSYNNLTVKSVMMLKWVQSYCDSISFVMKTDDDMFVNLPALVALLKSTTRTTNLLLGSLICRAKPILDTNSKWYTPHYMYHGQTYPNYLSGTGYVMSYDVVTRLYQTALETPLIHIEDVYITGICAKRAGIRPRNHPGFTYQRRKLSESCNPHHLTNHRLTTEDLHTAWSYLSNCSISLDQITIDSMPRSTKHRVNHCNWSPVSIT